MLGKDTATKEPPAKPKRSELLSELPIRNKGQLGFFARTIEDIRE